MGTVSSFAFGLRNMDKCFEGGDKTRGFVAGEQMIGVLDGTANVLKKADGAVQSIFQKLGKADVLENMVKQTGANSNIGAVASKTVNPLLCVASGIRVLNDDDQYAALIEETCAMTTMFGAESIMKYARTATTGGTQATSGMAGKISNMMSSSSKIKELGESAGKWFSNLANTKGGNSKQMLAKIGIDLLFVAGSILAFSLGHKVGETLTGRSGKNEKTEQKTELKDIKETIEILKNNRQQKEYIT